MRESKQLCNTGSTMNVINEKGQRVPLWGRREKKEHKLGVNHKSPMQCVVDVLRNLKTLHVSHPICWSDTLLKSSFALPKDENSSLKLQIAACSLLFMEVWRSVIHATGPRGSIQHLFQFTQIHTPHRLNPWLIQHVTSYTFSSNPLSRSWKWLISHCNAWVTS